MNDTQLNAIREADNYLRAAGLPTYSEATAAEREACAKHCEDTASESGEGKSLAASLRSGQHLTQQPAAAGVSDAEIREQFEDSIKRSAIAATTPLGTVTINDAFHHYADPDTDTMWLGYRAGFKRARAILALRPQAVPMTEEQRQQAFNKSWATSSDFFAGIEAAEAHHGIAAPAGGEG